MYNIDYPQFKKIDESWIALLVLAILILILSISCIVVLFILWRRYQQSKQLKQQQQYMLSNKPIGVRPIPVQVSERSSPVYETQKVEVFVPQTTDDTMDQDLGEIHARFSPENGIHYMHQYNQRRAMKAYF